jgi:hypothetical protein
MQNRTFSKVSEILQWETEGSIPMDETALLHGQTVEAHDFTLGTLKQFLTSVVNSNIRLKMCIFSINNMGIYLMLIT